MHGCPVIATTAASLPEVCGDAALFADPDLDEQWIKAVARLLRHGELRCELLEKGFRRAELYTWRRAAETYLSLMSSFDEAA